MEIILSYTFLACGISLLLVLLSSQLAGMKSAKWPQTIGTVHRAKVSEIPGTKRYGPLVEYTYKVNNKIYTSTSVDCNLFTTGDKDYVESIISKLRDKNELIVFYHPWIHNISLIIPGMRINKMFVIFMFISIVMICIGIYAVVKST